MVLRIAATMFLALCCTASAQRIIFVRSTATGKSDGTTWNDAYRDLQDALDDVRSNGGCPCEIWVAAGVYKPDRGTGDREMAFELADQLAIVGGFAGHEVERTEADPFKNLTVLSGDLAGDDDRSAFSQSTCCSENRQQSGCDDAACAAAVSTTWPDCIYRWSSVCAGVAQSICCELCRPTRCENSYNVVRLDVSNAAATVSGFTVRAGEANAQEEESYYYLGGGGAINAYEGSVKVSNCIIEENFGYQGSAMRSHSGLDVEYSVVRKNEGSVAINVVIGEVSIRDCTFQQNERGAVYRGSGNTVLVERCCFTDNSSISDFGSAIDARFGDLLIVGSLFAHNQNTPVWANSSDISVLHSAFIGNSAPSGSAALRASDAAVLLKNCLFAGNRAGSEVPYPGAPPTGSGTLSAPFGSVTVENCTFFGNVTGTGGGLSATTANVKNSIFYGNYDEGFGFGERAQIRADNLTVTHSIVHGWTGVFGGVGNSGSNPRFVNAFGYDRIVGTLDDDLRLHSFSPAVNAGLLTATTPDADLDGHPRVLCGGLDIGAYEFGIGDSDCDGIIDLLDYQLWPACMTGPEQPYPMPQCANFDYDADGQIDAADFAAFANSLTGPSEN